MLRSTRPVFLLMALCMLALAVTSCAVPGRGPGPMVQPETLSTPELFVRADDAWAADFMPQALVMYQALIDRPELTPPQRSLAFERAAASATASGNEELAIQTLKRWAQAEPDVKNGWRWHGLYVQTLEGLGLDDLYVDHLRGLLATRDVSWEVRREAALALAGHAVREGGLTGPGGAAEILTEAYAQAPDTQTRADLEIALLEQLRAQPDDVLLPLLDSGQGDAAWIFPHTIMRLAAAERLAQVEPDRWQDSWRVVRQLSVQGRFADPGPVLEAQAQLEAGRGTPRTGMALALPLTGRFSAYGWKVSAGASLAQRELAQQGVNIELRVINTEQQGWREELAALPPGFSVVGGPLSTERVRELSESGLLSERVFLSFVSSLEPVVEGEDAWRFFGSLNDQVDRLLDLAANDFGIHEFAVLAPAEPYGERMRTIFERTAADRGLAVAAVETYPPASPPAWGASVRDLLWGKDADGDKYAAREDPGFRAIFMPDGWKQAQLLAPHVFFHDGEHLLLMGPELWSQALTKDVKEFDASYFRLAVCPGSWWPEADRPGTRELRAAMRDAGWGEPEFWHALGYDFVRFTARLGGFAPGWRPEEVTARLNTAPAMDWSLAPLSWDTWGKAHQHLFLFRPTSKGLRQVDPEQLFSRLQQAKDTHEQRMDARREEQEKKAP